MHGPPNKIHRCEKSPAKMPWLGKPPIKARASSHYTHIGMAKIPNTDDTNAGEDKAPEHSFSIAGGNAE